MSLLAPLPPAGASRVVYLGTPEIAVSPLRALVAAGCDVQLVVTRPDVRRGRGAAISASPVKRAAQELGIRVSESLDDVVSLAKESDSSDILGVVVAYGALIPMTVLSAVPMINVHFSLLPRWRGAAPVERSLLAGDKQTGVCIMRVEAGLDLGEVYARREVAITEDDTLETLRGKLLDASLPLLVSAVQNGCGEGIAQSGEVTYAAKISARELRIDWSTSAMEIHRWVRLGGAYTTWANKRIKILRARIKEDGSVSDSLYCPGTIIVASRSECWIATGSGVLVLDDVQPEGKSAMNIEEWLNGARIAPGAVFI